MKTVVVANQKGGVGKTTVTCHLAFALRDHGHDTLVVDLDSQGNASKTLKASASGVTATELFTDPDAWSRVKKQPGLTLIAANDALSDLDRADTKVIASFRQSMTKLADQYAFAVIDTPPVIGLRMMAGLISSNFALCPIELEGYSIDGITKMLQTIFGVKGKYNEGLTFLGMLPNRFNPNSQSQRANLDELLRSYAHLMITAKIGNRSSISDALGQGIPVWEIPKTAAREAGREVRDALSLVLGKMEDNA
jgi:chromosome partitioning protein